jgi:hypothetical protein
MKKTTKHKINKIISLMLCMAMVTTFTIKKPVTAEENPEDTTTEEMTTEEATISGDFAKDVDSLIEKGSPYDMKEVYEIYQNAPNEINPANDWGTNEEDAQRVSPFRDILKEVAKQNHTDEATGIFIGDDTPWYIKIEAEEIEADPLQESYEAYLEKQQESDDEEDNEEDDDEEDDDESNEADDDEEDVEDDQDDLEDEEDWDEDEVEEKRTPLQEDAALYLAYQRGGFLGIAEYDNDTESERKVAKAYKVRFYHAITEEEYSCEKDQYIRIFFPYQREYLGYDTEVFQEKNEDIQFYSTYLFDEEETGMYEQSEEDVDDSDEDDDIEEDVEEDDLDEESDEDNESEEESNDDIDCSRYDLVCEIESSGTYGILLSELSINDATSKRSEGTKGTVPTGDGAKRYVWFFFGASMIASGFLLTGRRKKYVR